MTRILSNQIVAHQTAAEAWEWAKYLITAHGENVLTEDRKMCREVQNLHLTVLNPLSNWPIKNSDWSITGLEKYAEQLMNPDPGDFSYTYGARLFDYETHYHANPDGTCSGPCIGIDQIGYAIDKLKEHPTTRRAIAITWNPDIDPDSEHVPCLQLLDFLIRGGKLNLTAVFRSQDISRAYIPNVYGLGQLMKHIADEVGVPVGSLTTISASAHIYIE